MWHKNIIGYKIKIILEYNITYMYIINHKYLNRKQSIIFFYKVENINKFTCIFTYNK